MAEQDKPKGMLVSGQEAVALVLQAFVALWAVTVSTPMAATLAIVAPFTGLVLSRIAERHADAFKGYARRFGGSKHKAREHSRRNRNDPNHREAIYWLFRMIQDAIDPAVVETVGYMVATYSEQGRRPDDFFRGLGRVLCDLEPGDMHDLRAMLRFMADDDNEELSLWSETGSDGEERIQVRTGRAGHRGLNQPLPSLPRLITLLKREGLAGVPPTPMTFGMAEVRSPDRTMRIAGAQVRRLLEIVEPEPFVGM